jgi:hypothetical protein
VDHVKHNILLGAMLTYSSADNEVIYPGVFNIWKEYIIYKITCIIIYIKETRFSKDELQCHYVVI